MYDISSEHKIYTMPCVTRGYILADTYIRMTSAAVFILFSSKKKSDPIIAIKITNYSSTWHVLVVQTNPLFSPSLSLYLKRPPLIVSVGLNRCLVSFHDNPVKYPAFV